MLEAHMPLMDVVKHPLQYLMFQKPDDFLD